MRNDADCRGDKPRDRWLSADYHTSLSTGSVVKCRPMEADSVAKDNIKGPRITWRHLPRIIAND